MKKKFIIVLSVVALAVFIPIFKSQAAELATKLKGRILLQVQSKGEAWYINPKDSKRYYMADGSAAYNILRTLGVGITNQDLAKIKADKTLAKKQQGKIFLQIESHGEAYYIDINGIAHYLKDGAAAYSIMRELGLGITNNDLMKINLSDQDEATSSIPEKVTFDVKIASSSCALTTTQDAYGNSLTYVRAIATGIAQGPVGARLELPIFIWSDDKFDCGDWTLTSGALIAVGSTCTRKEGQATTTTWTVDTGGEEQGDWLKGKTRSYSAKIYPQGEIFAQKQDATSTVCQ